MMCIRVYGDQKWFNIGRALYGYQLLCRALGFANVFKSLNSEHYSIWASVSCQLISWNGLLEVVLKAKLWSGGAVFYLKNLVILKKLRAS